LKAAHFHRFPHALMAAVVWISGACAQTPASPDSSAQREAKALLREHLKHLNQTYAFGTWSDQLTRAQADLETLRTLAQLRPIKKSLAGKFASFDQQLRDLQASRPLVQKLINEMYVQVVVFRVEEGLKNKGIPFSPEARTEFAAQLKPFEAGSLQPKTSFLAGLSSLEATYSQLRLGWMTAYAEAVLAERIEKLLAGFDLQKNETLYDNYRLQLDYWRGQIAKNSPQARDELNTLSGQWQSDRPAVQEILGKLSDVLNTDMLFSHLLETAQKDGVDFSIEVEEHIEDQLRERQGELRAPVEQRMAAWNVFQSDLKSSLDLAARESENQYQQKMAEAEREEQEREMREALRLEQERQERQQKEKFKATLTAIKTFTFKGENSVSIDGDATKALGTQSGFLKSSYVGSGKVKLKVGKEKFHDTLAFVDKFNVADASIDLSKMSLDEKANQSAYVYTSPEGRTSNKDLERFVDLVALGSFSTGYNFFSYVPGSKWRLNSRIHWRQDKGPGEETKDRTLGYVDLVVDAHRVRSGQMAAGEKKTVVRAVNVPANMIILFDAQGGIKRFASFSDVSEIIIRPKDLTGGKIYYKFLNYSTDRTNIYLNGIDPEIKTAVPEA